MVFSGVINEQTIKQELQKYAEGKLLPYFKRFEPSELGQTGKSFTGVLLELQTGIKSVVEVFR